MKATRRLLAVAAAAALAAAGCGTQKSNLLLPSQAPEVELFAQRVDHSTAGPFTYQFQWAASAGGRVDHFLYSFGSPGEDPRHGEWTSTPAREHVLSFSPPDSAPPPPKGCGGGQPRVFSVRAVDAAGAMSAPAHVALFNGALAPSVQIVSPPANPLVRYYVLQDVCIEWLGTAPGDGLPSQDHIAQYKFILLDETTEVTAATARMMPDSVRRYYAPRNWAGWDSTSGHATGTVLRNLTLNKEYVFVVTCFDECGNYDPIFSFNHNMLYMRVTLSGAQLPRIGVFNEFLLYEQPLGRFDPSQVVNLEVPAERPITFNWYAYPVRDINGNPVGTPIQGYRWALDLTELDDVSQRNPAAGGSRRWSRWDIANTSARVGPFHGGEVHHFYIEARDGSGCGSDSGGVSLLTLRLNVVQPSFAHELLIVDDTRLVLDRRAAGTVCESAVNRPTGLWPTQAELDTFLYARGGAPWRCYPPGTMSTPGIFSGYDFDTIGTNLRVVDLTIPLSKLSQYRHVLWLTDAAGAFNNKPGTDLGDIGGPMTSMRYMNDNRRINTLGAYVSQGGKVWIAGGGAATAAMINFNRQFNDNTLPNPRTLTFNNAAGELVPGRFIYDQGHWRSEFKQFRVNGGRIRRYLGRFDPATGGNPGVYASLPAEIERKSPATDPFPPNRTGQSPSVFYQTQFDIEFLSAANEILEDQDPRPHHDNFQPTLDSLYKATAPSLQPDTGPGALQSVTMTYYHGAENAPFVHTGFNLWNHRRAQCVALVDFVLQQLWGLTRQGPVAGPIIEADARRAGPPPGRSSVPREGATVATQGAGIRR